MRRLSFEELENRVKKDNRKFKLLHETPNNNVLCECMVCGQQFEKHRKELWSKFSGCPVCGNNKTIKGYNDIATTDPWMVKYFYNKEDVYKYRSQSMYKAKVKCPDCGNIRSMLVSNLYKRGFSCACKGSTHYTITGMNDIATTDPWMIDYFVNKEMPYKYRANSIAKTDFKCPNCNAVINRTIATIKRNGFCCPVCSDNVSYPNKFGRSFIQQTPAENIEFEYIRDWTDGRFFDIYFEYQNKKYFIEMDGGGHYVSSFGVDLKGVQNNDLYKNQLAKEHDIIMIRIDCRKSNKEYISNSIKNSILSSIFDLNSIDWDLCEANCNSSLIRLIWDEYNKDELTLSEISEKYHMCIQTVEKYIKAGKQQGICDSSESNAKRARRIMNKRKQLDTNII